MPNAERTSWALSQFITSFGFGRLGALPLPVCLVCAPWLEFDTTRLTDARQGTVDDTGEFGGILLRPFLSQSPFGFPRRKPCGISIGLQGWIEPGYFTEIGVCRHFDRSRAARSGLPPNIPGERSFLNAAMDPGFFECLQRGCLRIRQARFGAALGEDPTATAGLNQQKLDATLADTVADRRHLFAAAHLAEAGQMEEAGRGRVRLGPGPSCG
jgi:hypothetical protein